MCFNNARSSGGTKFPGGRTVLQQQGWGSSTKQLPDNSAASMLTPLSRPGTTISTTNVNENQQGNAPEGSGAGMLSGQGYNDLMTQARAITPETAGMRSWKTGELLSPLPMGPYYYDPYIMADIERMKLLPPFVMANYGAPPSGGYSPEVNAEVEKLIRQIKGVGGDRQLFI